MKTKTTCVVLLVCASLASVALGGVAAGAGDDRELDATRAEKARKQAELKAAQLTERQLEESLARLPRQIEEQSKRAEQAELSFKAALEAAEAARQRLHSTRAELERARSRFHARARATYKAGRTSVAEVFVSSRSLSKVGLGIYLLGRLSEADMDVAQSLEALAKNLEEDEARFVEESRRADEARRRAEEATARLVELQQEHDVAKRELDRRIVDLRAEVEALAREERRIRAIIAARQRAAERELAAQRTSKRTQGGLESGAAPRGDGHVAASQRPGSSRARLSWPVRGIVTSGYGMRWGRLHAGIDIAAPEGTPVAAAADGKVIFTGWAGGYGNLVLIAHGDGIVTAYAHLASIAVGQGAGVARGSVIGTVGSTGHSTGPHLHFEVRVDGTPVDPIAYL